MTRLQYSIRHTSQYAKNVTWYAGLEASCYHPWKNKESMRLVFKDIRDAEDAFTIAIGLGRHDLLGVTELLSWDGSTHTRIRAWERLDGNPGRAVVQAPGSIRPPRRI